MTASSLSLYAYTVLSPLRPSAGLVLIVGSSSALALALGRPRRRALDLSSVALDFSTILPRAWGKVIERRVDARKLDFVDPRGVARPFVIGPKLQPFIGEAEK
jgi:hypothetical protein